MSCSRDLGRYLHCKVEEKTRLHEDSKGLFLTKYFFVAFLNVTKHSLQRWMSVIFMSHTTQRGRPSTTALERTPTENECQEKTVFQN